ncbi:MAG: hypothetical protein ABEJ57_08020 [Halobacteriaceae archaeon]
MATGDDVGTVPDERADTLEVALWGLVFLFTLGLFVYEFGLGALHAGHVDLQPIGEITDFAQTMWLSALIGGGGVVALIVYAVVRFGAGVRDQPSPLVPRQGLLKFMVFILAVTVVVGTTVFVGAATLAQTDEAGPAQAAEAYGVDREVEMSVLASQWFWRFDVEGVPVDQGEHVVLPADTIIQFQTTSPDVIHSFSIKQLGITKDAIPGQTNNAWFYVGHVSGETQFTYMTANGTVTVPADTYQVRCAELCGKGHSKMLATIYIMSPENYRAWVEAMGGHGDDAFSAPDNAIVVGNETTSGGGGHDDGGGH